MNKKAYIRPEITRIEIDNTITLRMASQPEDPPPRNKKGTQQSEPPFKSPFGEKPFG